jgi:hypothetical protein
MTIETGMAASGAIASDSLNSVRSSFDLSTGSYN